MYIWVCIDVNICISSFVHWKGQEANIFSSNEHTLHLFSNLFPTKRDQEPVGKMTGSKGWGRVGTG